MIKIEKLDLIITTTVLTVIEVISSITAGTVLPSIEQDFGSETNKILWIINIYMVTSAIIMPLTGYLVSCFGQRRLLLISVLGFMISSMACGSAYNLQIMLIARGLQGIFGGVLIPISLAILRNAFSENKLPKAMAIWNFGIMVAPVFGPIVGGYISAIASWPWIFYINVPLCALGILLCSLFVPETSKHKKNLNWFSLILITLSIGGLQFLLYTEGEFYILKSKFLIAGFIFSGISLFAYILRKRSKVSIINYKVFQNINFLVCSILYMLYSAAMFATLTIQPILLQKTMNFSIINTGFILALRGLSCICTVFITPFLMYHFKIHTLLIFGLLFSTLANFMIGQATLAASIYKFSLAEILQGIGIALFTVPLSAQAFLTLNKHYSHDAAGIYTYLRALGVSIGLSIISSQLSFHTEVEKQEPLEVKNNCEVSPTYFSNYFLNKFAFLIDTYVFSPVNVQTSQIDIFLKQYNNLSIFLLILIPFIFILIRNKFEEGKAEKGISIGDALTKE